MHPRRPAFQARRRGFTLVELMVVVAIVAIVAAFGVPQMTSMIRASKVRTAASDFYASLLTARSEAIKRRLAVSVTPLGSAWTTGWKVTYNTTSVVNTTPALASDVSVQINVPATTTTSAIVYGSSGRITSTAPTLIFHTSGDVSVQARCVTVDASGLPRIRTDTNSVATDGCN